MQDRGRERESEQGGTHAEIGREIESEPSMPNPAISRSAACSGVEFKPVRQA